MFMIRGCRAEVGKQFERASAESVSITKFTSGPRFESLQPEQLVMALWL